MANLAPDTREDAAPSEPPLFSTTSCPWMDNPVSDPRGDAAFSKLPDIPKEFGQDNGKFYKHYDAVAKELDDNMVESLKDQLDGLLIYAGLFAGVNATFLALTLPLLSASPADDTNALLRENNAILLQIALNRNDSFPIASPLPSESFSVSGRVLTVNILFSISLTLALMSSLFAVLGRQWLVEYRSRTGGGTDDQRRERISCYLGARRWQLEWLLRDILPTLLQIGLILFGISLTIYLSTLHSTLMKIVAAFIGTGIAILVCIGIFAIWDPYCPFQTPLSRMITYVIAVTLEGIIIMALYVGWNALDVVRRLLLLIVRRFFSGIRIVISPMIGRRRQQSLEAIQRFLNDLNLRWNRFWLPFIQLFRPRIVPFVQHGTRMAVALTTSQVEAVGRVIGYSDDHVVLMNAISNLLSIGDRRVLRRLANNDQFCHSLSRLCRTTYIETSHRQDPDRTELAAAATWRYRAAMARVAFSGQSKASPFMIRHLIGTSIHRLLGIGDKHGLAIPSDFIKTSPPAVIDDCLGYVALLSVRDPRLRPILGQMVTTEFEGLIDSSWERISIIIVCMCLSCETVYWTESELSDAFKGEPSTVLENLFWLIDPCTDPSCSVHITSRKYLPEIFKFIGKAAIDSSGQSTIGIDLIAQFLHSSELNSRQGWWPAEFSPVARGPRKDLINALRSKCAEIMDTGHRHDGSGTNFEMVEAWFGDLRGGLFSTSREDSADMRNAALSDLMSGAKMPWSLSEAVEWLIGLFRTLTNPGWLTISSNDDDLELVDLFSPVLQLLDELPLGNRFKVRVRRLRREFENFTTIVNRVAQSRDRDPSTDSIAGASTESSINESSVPSRDIVWYPISSSLVNCSVRSGEL